MILVPIALGLGALGIAINAQVGLTLASSPVAASTFAGLAIAGDVLAIALPSVGTALWRGAHRGLSSAAWLTWTGVAILATMASLTFASVNMDDRSAARSAVVTTASALADQRAARISAAKLTADTATKAREAECAIRGNHCRQREADELAALAALNSALALPIPAATPISDAAPEISASVRLARWVGLPLMDTDFVNLRLVLMALLPQAAGLVLAFGIALRRRAT